MRSHDPIPQALAGPLVWPEPRRLSRLYPTRWLRGYVMVKVRTDPVYRKVLELLAGTSEPVLDLGCGIGLVEAILRESGVNVPITGVDSDAAKVEVARSAIGQTYQGLEFVAEDVRKARAFSGSVLLLDLLHYFTQADQDEILRRVAERVSPAGVVIIRECVNDGSWRFRVTWLEEAFARATGWLGGERLKFPTREAIERPFLERGFTAVVTPLWGRTPFNNYLFVFRPPHNSRSSEGTTKE